jgi:hypothetical protein
MISASRTGTRAAGAGFVVRGIRQLQPLRPDRHAGRGPARPATHAGSGVAAGGAAVRDGSSAGDRLRAAAPSTSPSVRPPRMLGRRRSWPASPLDRTAQNLQVLSSSGVAVSRETSPCRPRRSWGSPAACLRNALARHVVHAAGAMLAVTRTAASTWAAPRFHGLAAWTHPCHMGVRWAPREGRHRQPPTLPRAAASTAIAPR